MERTQVLLENMPSGIEETSANSSFMKLAVGWCTADPVAPSSNSSLVTSFFSMNYSK